MYSREVKEIVENVSKTFKVLFVFGPRGVGKTTLLLSLKSDNMEYITLDDEVLREQVKSDSKLFLYNSFYNTLGSLDTLTKYRVRKVILKNRKNVLTNISSR